jgi:hypothetical protein
MGINKFANSLGSDDKAFFHSSGYAEAAHGKNLGVGSSQTFSERHHMERNRQAVGRYRDSMVASGPGEQEKESRIAEPGSYSRDKLQVGPRQNGRSGIAPVSRPTFIEPPTRKYNPYA